MITWRDWIVFGAAAVALAICLTPQWRASADAALPYSWIYFVPALIGLYLDNWIVMVASFLTFPLIWALLHLRGERRDHSKHRYRNDPPARRDQ